MSDGVSLIAYADRLAGDLPGLRRLLAGPLAGFAGVHLLPFYVPFDGADAGFDPADHLTVDPRLGHWDDLVALADDGLAVTADLIVNHVSAESEAFRRWRSRDAGPAEEGMFLTYGAVFPDGATEEDLTRIFRPRPGLPFTPVVRADGSRRLVWTTFGSDQVDLDVRNPAVRAYHDAVLDALAAARVRTVRLDAAGYAVKTAGSSCFVTGETLAFIAELTGRAHRRGLEVLVEIHGHHRAQRAVAEVADRVYDFGLPPLVLEALFAGRVDRLASWLEVRPTNSVNVLDTHDGIGIVDVAAADGAPGLLAASEISALVEQVARHTGGLSERASSRVPWSDVPYALNTTYLDALGRDEQAYLVARIVQLLLPGPAHVYYVGLLAGTNDTARFAATGAGRELNRRVYDPEALRTALARPLVRAVLALVRLRGRHPAFAGTGGWEQDGLSRLRFGWCSGDHEVDATVDVASPGFRLRVSGPGGVHVASDVDELAALADVGW
jgi:sucrose phosphorylase